MITPYAPAGLLSGRAQNPASFLAPNTIFFSDAPEAYLKYASVRFSKRNRAWHPSAKRVKAIVTFYFLLSTFYLATKGSDL